MHISTSTIPRLLRHGSVVAKGARKTHLGSRNSDKKRLLSEYDLRSLPRTEPDLRWYLLYRLRPKANGANLCSHNLRIEQGTQIYITWYRSSRADQLSGRTMGTREATLRRVLRRVVVPFIWTRVCCECNLRVKETRGESLPILAIGIRLREAEGIQETLFFPCSKQRV